MTACKKLAAVAALFATVGTAQASGLQAGLSGPTTCPDSFEVSSGLSAIVHARAGIAVSSTAGQERCVRFVSPCTGVMTRIAFDLTAGVASSQMQAAVYSGDGTALVAQGDLEDGNSVTTHATASLTIPLTQGTKYLACLASSETATHTYSGPSATSNYPHTAFSTDSTFVTGATIAQFNGTCTAGATPYACCSGANTGTCTGAPASLGALTSASAGMPFIWLGR